MPKVVIKEFDETSPGLVTSNNFTVLIPGFVDEAVWGATDNKKKDGTEIFDANNIYECVTQTDFVSYVGKVAPVNPATTKAHGPTITGEGRTVTGVEFTSTYLNKLYTKAVDSEAESEGKLVEKEETIDPLDPEHSIITYYRYTLANKTETIAQGDFSNYDENTEYYLIEPGNEGNDASAAQIAHYGNQMAYLLLGLGYTVLYLKINELSDLINEATWEPLRDKSIYDFRYIVTGLIKDETAANVLCNQVSKIIAEIARNANDHTVDSAESYAAEGRGDCIALVDIPKNVYMEDNTELEIARPMTQAKFVQAVKANMPAVNEYSGIFAPTVFYSGIEDDAYDKNVELPASFHYLACASQSFSRYPEWFAVAGYNRGICNYAVQGTSITLGDAAVNALQTRAGNDIGVNLVIKLRNGYYLWGNRTGRKNETNGLIASNFLNIRQLCCTLKKTIYNVCRRLMFDPNSEILWLNFCNAIRPTLERMMSSQGIKGYRFEKRDTEMKGKLFAIIRIIPIEAVEDFEIGVYLEDNFDNENIQVIERLIG